MSWIKDYRLIRDLDEAEALLAMPGWAILGGGSHLVAVRPPGIDKLIDLLPLGLDGIRAAAGRIRFGARLRLQELAEREDYGGLLREAVQSLAHSVNLRNQMTLAGEVAWTSPRNELQTALLVLDAVVIRHLREPLSLADYLAAPEREGIITAITLSADEGWTHAFRKVSHAEGGRPLLAMAGAARIEAGKLADLRLALGNLGAYPQRALALETRLRGEALNALSGQSMGATDREGLEVVDEHEAAADSKWQWADALFAEVLAALAEGAGA